MTTEQPEIDIDDEIDAEIDRFSEEDLTQILLMTGKVQAGILDTDEDWDADTVQRVALRCFIAGYISGTQDAQNAPQASPTDLLVGITPEDAATIVAGLLGDGATITLGVIRQG